MAGTWLADERPTEENGELLREVSTSYWQRGSRRLGATLYSRSLIAEMRTDACGYTEEELELRVEDRSEGGLGECEDWYDAVWGVGLAGTVEAQDRLVTRNVADVSRTGVAVHNPFEPAEEGGAGRA